MASSLLSGFRKIYNAASGIWGGRSMYPAIPRDVEAANDYER